MAQLDLDPTGNEGFPQLVAKLQTMFTELYAALQGIINVSSLTITGLFTSGTLKVGTGTKTASATAGAATLNKPFGKITSEALTTAAGAVYTLTLTNSQIAAADQVFASLANGTNTQGAPRIETVTPGAGSVVITVRNGHASEALNGTLVISFGSLKN